MGKVAVREMDVIDRKKNGSGDRKVHGRVEDRLVWVD